MIRSDTPVDLRALARRAARLGLEIEEMEDGRVKVIRQSDGKVIAVASEGTVAVGNHLLRIAPPSPGNRTVIEVERYDTPRANGKDSRAFVTEVADHWNISDAVRLYREGYSLPQVARMTGRTEQEIREVAESL